MEQADKGKISQATKDAPFDQAPAKKPGTNQGRCNMGELHHVLEDVVDSLDTMCLSPRSDDPTSTTSESLSQASPLCVRYEDTTTIKIEGLNTVHADNVKAGSQVKIEQPTQKSVITLRFSRLENGLPVYDVVSPVSDTRATTQGVKEESINVKKMPSQIITASSSFQTDITIGKAMTQAPTLVRGTGAIPKEHGQIKPHKDLVIPESRRKKVEKSKKKMSGNELTSEQSEISDVDTSFGFFKNPEEVNFLKVLHDQLIEAKLAYEENELIRSINLSYALEHIQARIQYLSDRVFLESSTSLRIGANFDTEEKDAFDIGNIRNNTDTTDPASSNEAFRTAESRPSSTGSIMTEKSTSTFARNTISTRKNAKMTNEKQSSLTKNKEKSMRKPTSSSKRSGRNNSISDDESASTIISNVQSMSLQVKTMKKQSSLTKDKEKSMRKPTSSSKRSARNKSNSKDENASTIISNVQSMSLQESLRLRRPKFIDHVERRSALIQELAEKRKLRAEIRKNFIRDHGFEAAAISMTSIVPPPPLAEQRLFTRQEMLLCNQKLWQNMSEQQFRLLEEQREKDKEIFRELRILYGKKLKDRAIKQKINVSNSSSILAEDDQKK